MAHEKRYQAVVLGRVIGTASGWDGLDFNAILFFDFHPAPGIAIPPGMISVMYDSGKVEIADDDGNITFSADLIDVLSGAERAKAA